MVNGVLSVWALGRGGAESWFCHSVHNCVTDQSSLINYFEPFCDCDCSLGTNATCEGKGQYERTLGS